MLRAPLDGHRKLRLYARLRSTTTVWRGSCQRSHDTHDPDLNIHAEESGTVEVLSYSLHLCKKKHIIVPLQWNINSFH